MSALSKNTWLEQLDMGNYVASEAGRIEVFVANESDTDVWFDNLTIIHKEALIVQENAYYPFGLEMTGLQKDNHNKFTFNAQSEKQKDLLGSGYFYETPFRGYDPQLGRFHGVDALADAFTGITPYQFGYNNPVRFNDPTGLCPECPKGTKHGQTFESSGGETYVFNKNSGESGDWERIGYQLEEVSVEANREYGTNGVSGSWGDDDESSSTDNGGESNNEVTGEPVELPESWSSSVSDGTSTRENSREFDPQLDFKNTSSSTWSGSATARALPWAAATSAADGPIPIGEAIGAVIVSGALAYDLTYYLYYGDGSTSKTDAPAVPLTGTKEKDDEGSIRVRHYTTQQGLVNIKKTNEIWARGSSPPYGVDVLTSVSQFSSVKPTEHLGANGNFFVEFSVLKSELIPIPGTGLLTHAGFSTARIPVTMDAKAASNNEETFSLIGRNPTFQGGKWWKFW